MTLETFMETENTLSGHEFKTPRSVKYPVKKLAAAEWKSFALYTVENRAIPNMISGLKPSQLMYLYSSLVSSKKEFEKCSAIGGQVSRFGFAHGEASCVGAGQLMAATWSNNICLVEGRGAFGSRLVQKAAAARYTYTRLSPNFNKYIMDLDLAPAHEDPEHIPPRFYIPVIPLVLANGVKGIATGFATDILPRDPKDLAKACLEYVKTGKIKTRPSIKFPEFSGDISYSQEDDRYTVCGTFEKKGNLLTITEVPPGYDRESYIKVLDDLDEEGKIQDYEDLCDKDGFKFSVKFKRGALEDLSDQDILKMFKLVKNMSENIVVIDQHGKLKIYDDAIDLIKDFCDFRSTILQKRIDLRIKEFSEELRWLKIKMEFVLAVLEDKIIFKKKGKSEVIEQIMANTRATEEEGDRLLRMNIMSLTQELVLELAEQIKEASASLKFWQETTVKDQFESDLKAVMS